LNLICSSEISAYNNANNYNIEPNVVVLMRTIQVKESTAQLLNEIKREYDATIYDTVINRLIELKNEIPKSRFGAHPEMTEFTEEDELK